MGTDSLVEILIAMTFGAVIVIAVFQLLRMRRARNEHSDLDDARRKLDS